MEIKHPPTYGF